MENIGCLFISSEKRNKWIFTTIHSFARTNNHYYYFMSCPVDVRETDGQLYIGRIFDDSTFNKQNITANEISHIKNDLFINKHFWTWDSTRTHKWIIRIYANHPKHKPFSVARTLKNLIGYRLQQKRYTISKRKKRAGFFLNRQQLRLSGLRNMNFKEFYF